MKVTKGIFALLMLPFEMESDCVLIVTYVTTVEGKKNSMWHSVLSIILFHSMALFFFVEVSVVAFCYSMSNREYVKAASDELQHCGF
jgi:hypothetical protein